MHQRSISKLHGALTLHGPLTPRITCERAQWRTRRGSRWLGCPAKRTPLWAWLLLGALVVPGAWSFLNEEQEELLVELHNHYRGQVSPSASAMMPLKWDPSLKLLAEGYAAKCIWNHNPDLDDTGENLFAGTGPLDLREAVEKWFLEHLDYNFHNNSCEEDKMCGHYTQMVWADTQRVGCAFHLCNNMEGLGWERVSFLVCNYYPAGNYEGERPYLEGDWCSRCPENLKLCENNMCAAEPEEEEEEEEEEVVAGDEQGMVQEELEELGAEQDVEEVEQAVQEAEEEVLEVEQAVQEVEQEVQEVEQEVPGVEQEVQEAEPEVQEAEPEVQEEVTTEPFVQTPHLIFIDVNKLTVQPLDTSTVPPTITPTVPHATNPTVPPSLPPTVPQSSSEEELDTPPPATSEAPTKPPAALGTEKEEEGKVVKIENKKEEEKKEEKRNEVPEKEKTVRAVPPKVPRGTGSRCTSSLLLVATLLLLLRM